MEERNRIAVSTLIEPLFRSSHFSCKRSISIGRIPVSRSMLKIRAYVFPALAISMFISSVVGTYGGWLNLLMNGFFQTMPLYLAYRSYALARLSL